MNTQANDTRNTSCVSIDIMSSPLPDISASLPSSMEESSLSYPSNSLREKKKRKDLIIFIRVLLDHLEKENPMLREIFRDAMKEIIQENRKGNPDYQPLAFSVQRRARSLVGEWHWCRVSRAINRCKCFSRISESHRISESENDIQAISIVDECKK
jgi:hypothetical protein